MRTTRPLIAIAIAVLASSATAVVAPPPASANLPAQTRLVSRTTAGDPVPGTVTDVSISGNGRFVAFATGASMDSRDTNGKRDIYVRDRWAATTELVSMTNAEQPINADAVMPTLSDDGRYVSFETAASNLIAGDDKGLVDGFVRDRYAGTTTRVAPGLSGALLTGSVSNTQLAGGGRYVLFQTSAENVVPNDTNGKSDAFVRDLQTGAIERVSLTALDGQSSGTTGRATISDDGRYIVFDNDALMAGGFVGEMNVYLRDRTAGTTELVSLTDGDVVGDGGASYPTISGNGRFVAFASGATNLVANDTNGEDDAFLRDRTAGTTVRISVHDDESQLATNSTPVAISDGGDALLFNTRSKASAAPDAGDDYDVYLRNTYSSSTRRITTGPSFADPAAQVVRGSLDDSGQDAAFAYTSKLTADAAFDQAYVSGPVRTVFDLTTTEMVQQQYQDFLGRSATSGEVATWTGRFSAGSAVPATLAAQLVADPVFAAKRAPMVRLYWAFFLRRPDASGLNYWIGKYQAGSSLSSIAQQFAKSSEFKNRYGTVSNQNYVKLVYQNVFERQPDAGGLSYWTGKLDKGQITRGGVIVQFSESSEGKRLLAGPTNITLLSMAMYRAVPDAATWNLLYPQVDAGERQAAWIAQTIISSNRYLGRFD